MGTGSSRKGNKVNLLPAELSFTWRKKESVVSLTWKLEIYLVMG